MKTNPVTLLIGSLVANTLVVGCDAPEDSVSERSFRNRGTVTLEQGWSEAEREAFYYTPQGSFLIPLDWYESLEVSSGPRLFSSASNMRSYGYLVEDGAHPLASTLPIGFAIEPTDSGEDWMGLTCAACHTSEIRYRGTTMRIDGGASLSDFNGFLAEMNESIEATLARPRKFERFARRVLGAASDAERDALRAELEAYAETQREFMARNAVEAHRNDHGRVDAFGIIMNEVFADDMGVPDNASTPNAPVSYPFLWGSPSHDWVQWNGSANNPLARNIGEVLGTFGSVELRDPARLGHSSARGAELIELENLVATLQAPAWPEDILGAIDADMAARGRTHYEQACASCHALPDENGLYPLTPPAENAFGVSFVETQMIGLQDIGTDPNMALNFATRQVETAHLAGFLPAPYTGAPQLPAPLLLNILVGITTQTELGELALPPEAQADAIGYRLRADGERYTPKNLVAYRARPLDGIWATAPYLHNGSVANLYELLLPASERATQFAVGSNRFDPTRVGFGTFFGGTFDVTEPGNSNAGHEYGTDLGEAERWELVEFLKTL